MQTIALYAYRFYDKLKPYSLPNEILLRLRALFSQRERLVSMHSQLLVANQSMKGYARELVKDIQTQNETLLKNLAEQIKTIDKSLKDCLQQDEELQRKAKLIQSVPGIGQQQVIFSSLGVVYKASLHRGSLHVIADVLPLHTHQQQVSGVKPKYILSPVRK